MNNKLAAFKMPQKQSMSAFANIPRQTEIMGQPHMLSYINPEEEAMLQQMRGGLPPVAGPGGVPAFANWYDGIVSAAKSFGNSISNSFSGNNQNDNTLSSAPAPTTFYNDYSDPDNPVLDTMSAVEDRRRGDGSTSSEYALANDKNFTPASAEPETFSDAFAENRAAGNETFTYNGNLYTTEVAERLDDGLWSNFDILPSTSTSGLTEVELPNGRSYYADESGTFKGFVPENEVEVEKTDYQKKLEAAGESDLSGLDQIAATNVDYTGVKNTNTVASTDSYNDTVVIPDPVSQTPVDYTTTSSGNDYTEAATTGSTNNNGSTYDEVPTSIDPDPELNAVEKLLVSNHGWTDNGDGTVTNKNGGIYDGDAGGYLEGYSFAGPDANPVNNYIPGYSGTVVGINTDFSIVPGDSRDDLSFDLTDPSEPLVTGNGVNFTGTYEGVTYVDGYPESAPLQVTIDESTYVPGQDTFESTFLNNYGVPVPTTESAFLALPDGAKQDLALLPKDDMEDLLQTISTTSGDNASVAETLINFGADLIGVRGVGDTDIKVVQSDEVNLLPPESETPPLNVEIISTEDYEKLVNGGTDSSVVGGYDEAGLNVGGGLGGVSGAINAFSDAITGSVVGGGGVGATDDDLATDFSAFENTETDSSVVLAEA